MTAGDRASMPRRPVLRAVTAAGAIAAFPALLGCAPVLDKKAPAGPDLDAAPGAVVMVIRHGEKPAKTDPAAGIDLSGHPDVHSLTAQSWTRAAYLVGLLGGAGDPAPLPRPAVIYASGPGKGDGEGTRPRETVGPLAAALDIPVDTTFSRGQETELAQRAAGQAGPTLICWQHESIPAIGDALAPASPAPPASWPDEVYDRVWVFTAVSGGWRFEDVPQTPGGTHEGASCWRARWSSTLWAPPRAELRSEVVHVPAQVPAHRPDRRLESSFGHPAGERGAGYAQAAGGLAGTDERRWGVCGGHAVDCVSSSGHSGLLGRLRRLFRSSHSASLKEVIRVV